VQQEENLDDEKSRIHSVTATMKQELSHEAFVFLETIRCIIEEQSAEKQLISLDKWISDINYKYNTNSFLRIVFNFSKDFVMIMENVINSLLGSLSVNNCIVFLVSLNSMEQLVVNYKKIHHSVNRSIRKILYFLLKIENEWMRHAIFMNSDVCHRFLQIIHNRCRLGNRMKKSMHQLLFTRSLYWHNYIVHHNYNENYQLINWNDVWEQVEKLVTSSNHKKKLLLVALTRQQHIWQPLPLTNLQSISNILIYNHMELMFVKQVFGLLSQEDKHSLVESDTGNCGLFKILCNVIYSHGILTTADINTLSEILKDFVDFIESDAVFKSIFKVLVEQVINNNGKDCMKSVCKEFMKDGYLKQHLIQALTMYQYMTISAQAILQEISVYLTNDQLESLFNNQMDSYLFIPMLVKLSRMRNNEDWIPMYFTKTATELEEQCIHYDNHTSMILFINLIINFNCCDIVPSETAIAELYEWMYSVRTSESIMKETASEFVKKYTPETDEWNENNLLTKVVEKLCSDYCIYLDGAYNWIDGLTFFNCKSRDSIVLMILRIFFQVRDKDRVPKLIPREFIDSNLVLYNIVRNKYDKLNEDLEQGRLSFIEWRSIYHLTDSFEQFGIFYPNHSMICHNKRENLLQSYVAMFDKLNHLNLVVSILVNQLRLSAKEQVDYLLSVSENKQTLSYTELQQGIADVNNVLVDLLDINQYDLKTMLSNDEFIERFHGIELTKETSRMIHATVMIKLMFLEQL
jgi:hypothetical protein